MGNNGNIFFEPWVGPDYANGIHLIGNQLEGNKEENNKNSHKVMILGKEHYCSKPNEKGNQVSDRNKDQILYIEHLRKIEKEGTVYLSNIQERNKYVKRQLDQISPLFADKSVKPQDIIKKLLEDACNHQNCPMHCKGNTVCGQLTICRHKTNEVVANYISKDKNTSFDNFIKALNTDKNILNSFLFCQFYQRSMSNTTNNEHTDNEIQIGVNSFAENIKTHTPDIVISWDGKKWGSFDYIIKAQRHLKKEYDIDIKIIPGCPPRLTIQDQNEEVPFAVLNWKDKENKEKTCLLLSTLYHPSASQFKAPKFREFFHNILCAVVKHYNNLCEWKPSFKEIIHLPEIECGIQRKRNIPDNIKKELESIRHTLKNNTYPVAKKVVALLDTLLHNNLSNPKATELRKRLPELKDLLAGVVKFNKNGKWTNLAECQKQGNLSSKP